MMMMRRKSDEMRRRRSDEIRSDRLRPNDLKTLS